MFAAKRCCQAFNVCGLDKETGGMQRARVALCLRERARVSLRQAALNVSVGKRRVPLFLIIGYSLGSDCNPILFDYWTLV